MSIKKVRFKMDFYILCAVLLVIIVLFIIAIICYHFAKNKPKRKEIYYHTKNIKLENNEF